MQPGNVQLVSTVWWEDWKDCEEPFEPKEKVDVG